MNPEEMSMIQRRSEIESILGLKLKNLIDAYKSNDPELIRKTTDEYEKLVDEMRFINPFMELSPIDQAIKEIAKDETRKHNLKLDLLDESKK